MGKIANSVVLFFLTISAFFVLLILTNSTLVASDETQSTQTSPSLPEAEKIGENLYRIGRLTVDMAKREVTVRGWINMNKGAIEYLACCAGGKLHESELVLDTKPMHLQIALILLGLEPKGNFEYQGDPSSPKGDPVEIWAQWKDGDEMKNVRAEQMILDSKKETPMKDTQWIFTGSAIFNGRFVADIEKSLIATYHDPAAIINNPLPEGADDTVYAVNSKLVPKRGTSVVLTIKAVEEKKSDVSSFTESSDPKNKDLTEEEKIIFQDNFDQGNLDTSKWNAIKDGDFKQFSTDVKNINNNGEKDYQLNLMANTMETSDQVKYLGIRNLQKIDFSEAKEVSCDLDWNDQQNGCYLTAGLYICPIESQNPKKEKDWIGFEWTGVPPGKNIRNSVLASTDGAMKELYTDWGPDRQGWPVKLGSYKIKLLLDSKGIRVWADSKQLCYVPYPLNFSSGYIYLQISSGTNYPSREVYFDNITVTGQ